MRAAGTGRCSATAQRAVCQGEASAPSVRSASARGRGRRPLLRRGLCRWSPRRRNMASKAAPSCRLVFCLLISAAVLRAGKNRGLGAAPGRPGPGGSFLGPGPGPRAPHPGGGAPRRMGEVRDRRCGQELALGSLTCAACLSSIAWLKLGQRLGALDKSPGSLGAAGVGASGGPQARFVWFSPLPPCGSRLGGELSPSDNPSGIKVHVTALWAVFLSPSSQRQ